MPTTTYPDTQTHLDDPKRGNPEIDHEDDTVIPELDIDNDGSDDGEDFDTEDAVDEAEDLDDGRDPDTDELPLEDDYGDEDL